MRRRSYTDHRGPKAIDPRTGFEVRLADLVKDGQTGDLIWSKVADRKQPQDLVRGIPDRMDLPYSRPEPPDRFMAVNLLWEDGIMPILMENGSPVLSQGEVVVL